MNQNITSVFVLIALIFSVAALSLSLSNALRGSSANDVADIHLTLSQAEVCLTLIGATGLAAHEDAFRLVSRDHWNKAGCDDYIASVAE